MLMRTPNGGVIDARKEAVQRLVAAGFTPMGPAEAPRAESKAAQRRASRRKLKTE